MSFNGSGTFLRIRNWTNDAIAGIKIRADRHDSEDDNFASGLSQCITKDGQTTITGNLPMATYRHTNVGSAVNATDYARYDQVQLGKAVWAVAGGTADAITATYSPPTTAPVDGQLYFVRAGYANATSTPTFSPDGQTARTIVREGGDALLVGDISGAGHELILRYNLANTRYELLNPAKVTSGSATDGHALLADGAGGSDWGDVSRLVPSNNLSDVANASTAFNNIKQNATTSATGVIEIATDAEMKAGSVANKAIVPDNWGNQQSKSSNGYQVLAGGVIIQWGSFANDAVSKTISFPTTFPNACRCVTIGDRADGDTGGVDIGTQLRATPTTSGADFTVPPALTVTYWIAIGY